LAWAAAKLGDPTVWIRVPSLILGVATVPLIFALGRETLGRAPGLLGAAIVAASPFSTYYGIEARPYATMLFFVTLSTLAVVKAVRTSGWRWWLLYALAAAAAAYSHYTCVFVLAVQAGWSIWMRRRRLFEPLLANLLIVLLYIPWLPYVRSKELAGVIALLEPLTAHNVLVDLSRPILGYPYAGPSAIPTYAGLAVVGGFALLGLAAVGWRTRRMAQLGPGGPATGALILALALATPVGVLLYSLLSADIWDARSLYASVPPGALVLAALLWALPRAVRALGIAAALVVLIAGTIKSITSSYARPPFRAAAAYLDSVAAPSDPVIFYPTFVDVDIAVHFKRRHRVMGSSAGQWRGIAPGRAAYLVIDDLFARRLRIGTPHAHGFVLTSRRRYPNHVASFTLLSYRPS
jgi:mannosyltransferase